MNTDSFIEFIYFFNEWLEQVINDQFQMHQTQKIR
jgi:hypothetical protein